MDPKLQYLLACKKNTPDKPRSPSGGEGYISVIARVTNLEAWEALTEVQAGVSIPSQDNEFIVTGRIALSSVEKIRKLPFVASLKASHAVRPAMHATLEDFKLNSKAIGNISISDLHGHSKNVIVGVVGYGCDFVHKSLRNADGTTRIAKIWDQSKGLNPHSPHGYGKVYSREKINSALQQNDPYAALGYDSQNDLFTSSHATHILDIAAGSGFKDEQGNEHPAGVASQAEIVFVELNSESTRTAQEVMETNFGDSVRLVEAVKYIFDYADQAGMPCVINLSLTTMGGPHDGSTLVERAIDEMVSRKDNRAVIIAAGNFFSENCHKSGIVEKNSYSEVDWIIPKNDRTSNEVEIWYSRNDEFEIEVLNKAGLSVARIPLGQNGYITENVNGEENVVCFISHRSNDPSNHDNVIHLFEKPKMQNSLGNWKLRLHGVRVTNGNYHAWVETDRPQGQSYFHQADSSYTLGSISCGKHSIVIAGYDAHRPAKPISFFSSAGPTRDGRNKPELSAPGHDVMAAGGGTTNAVVRLSGTSRAAPAVAGLVALMFGFAKHLEKSMSISTTLQILQEAANKANNEGKEWHNRYGYGMASAAVFEHAFFAPQPRIEGNPASLSANANLSEPARKIV